MSCRKNLTPLQQRSGRMMGGLLTITVAISILTQSPLKSGHLPTFLLFMIAALETFPVVAAIVIIGRYMSAEPDEFIRMLLTRAMLWGFAITMASDAFVGVLMQYHHAHLPLALLNADLFIASGMIAFRIQRERY